MANFQQVATALQHAASNKQAANTYLQDPAAMWKAAGVTLPPGVTPAQFSHRVAGAGIHKDIVSTSKGQMGVLDWSECAKCQAVVGYCLSGAGLITVGGVAVVAAPEASAIAWLSGIFGVPGSVILGAGAVMVATATHSICRSMGACK